MSEMSTFKIIVVTIFSLCILAALAIFALTSSTFSTKTVNLTAWGTLSGEAFDAAYRASSLPAADVKINYVIKDPASFESEFVEALANGEGPDIVIIRDDLIYKDRNKLFVIPYKNFSERTFKDRFIEEGELFLSSEGVVAFPFTVDPMVMYWNRDIFSNNVIAQPPKYWDEVYPLVTKITKRDANANILQSTVALGEWTNITHAKEIISMILMQAGTPIVKRTSLGVVSVLNSSFDYPVAPSQSAMSFYTQFSNPTGALYTWNRALPSSFNFFLSGNLAMYIGFASEIFSIQQKNSNLNFDVTYVPQIRNAPQRSVFGHMYSLAIVKQSKQIGSAFTSIVALTEPAALKSLEKFTNLPPVRRDLLADKPTDAYRSVFYDSALISHSWIDPNPQESSNTFRDMIQSITSGQSRQSEALGRADSELSEQLK